MKKLSLIFICLLIVSCATSPTGRKQLMLVSPKQAISASKEAYVQALAPLQKDGKIDNNRSLAKRVQRVTGRIVAQAIKAYPHTKKWDWQIKVIDEPNTVNAWCMAGGRMAIYTGLINKIKPTDDELAQVMGHEVSHALANHTAEKMSVAILTKLGMSAVEIATDKKYRDYALQGASLAAAVAVTLPNSRGAETEADQIGIKLAAKAGYNPKAAASLWQKMGAAGGKSQPEFLSTHPAPKSRQKRLSKLAKDLMDDYHQSGNPAQYSFQK